MTTRIAPLVIVSLFFTVAVSACGGDTSQPDFPATIAAAVQATRTAIAQTASSAGATSTDFPIATLTSPLSNIEFPAQPISYPPAWPTELHYPNEFKLVDASSGQLPDNDVAGWAAKLQFEGNVENALSQLRSYFESRGWRIGEIMELDSGGVLMLLEKGDHGQGIVAIASDANNPRSVNVVITVLP